LAVEGAGIVRKVRGSLYTASFQRSDESSRGRAKIAYSISWLLKLAMTVVKNIRSRVVQDNIIVTTGQFICTMLIIAAIFKNQTYSYERTTN
jgi:hypothetical protein